MWNFKRVLLMIAGFAAFFTCFTVYAHFMGGIDGLPPLPPAYWPPDPSTSGSDVLPVTPRDEVNRKLAQAFGEHNDVLDRTIKLETSRRGMVMATDKFEIMDDGKARLQPLRVAIFGKAHGPDGTPEINTVSCDVAILEFDERISSISDMAGRKVVAADLFGNIKLVNNRRTAQQDDDVSLFTQGPIHYVASRHQIFTDKDVRVVDLKSKPQPTTITGTELAITLTDENAPAGNDAAHKKNGSVNGVDTIRLGKNVEMHLFIEGDSGFMSSGKKPAATATASKTKTPAAPPKPSHVTITTDGPFVYDVQKQHAEFDVSGPGAFANLAEYTNWVTVIREQQQHMQDTLKCQHLELQFRRREATANGPAAPPPRSDDTGEASMDIETAHATVTGERELKIHSDAENLEAWGKDLFFDNRTKTTILKGEPEQPFPYDQAPRPMRAVKDGNVIYARELRLVEVDGVQQATGIGPGRIELFDKTTKTPRPVTALWRDKLVSNKDGGFDCLTLTGDAVFDDVEHDQKLCADSLKVWLKPQDHTTTNPAPPKVTKDGKEAAAPEQRAKPHHVVAKGHVRTESTQLHIEDSPEHPTDMLVIWFKDVPPGQLPEPAHTDKPTTAGAAPAKAGTTAGATATNAPAAATTASAAASTGPPSSTSAGTQPAVPGTAPAAQPPAKQPIHLNAHSIEAYVLRSEARNEIDRLWCEGDVHVHQEGSTSGDDGVDITGETLQMTHFVEGNVLVVTGDVANAHTGDPASVRMDKTTIIGPEVTINQKENTANVRGGGTMRMPAKSDFNGKNLQKPVDMIVKWRDNMTFDGRNADFYGHVTATQENSRLTCNDMHVVLDRAVSFKENEKGKAPAKVDQVVCDKHVWVEEDVKRNGVRESYKRLEVPSLAMDNNDGRFTAPGPGRVTILQRGEDGPLAMGPTPEKAPAKPAAKPSAKLTSKPGGKKGAAEEPMKLTRVVFRDRLYANNQTRTATFYGGIEMINLPSENPDVTVDRDHPPEGFMYLTCDQQLKVFSNSNKHQLMEARYRVYIESRGHFFAYSNELKYDEEKEQIILIGSPGNPASLYRVLRKGAEPERIVGMKIYYWRKTNDVKVEQGEDINVTH